MNIQILIADAHAMFRDALRSLIEQEPGFQVVGEASDGLEVARLVKELSPDLLLLDLAMKSMSGLEVIRELKDRAAEVPTILLTAVIKRSQLVEAMKLGARGVMLKENSTSHLFKGISAVMRGEYWFRREDIVNFIDCIRDGTLEHGKAEHFGSDLHLSPRELQIMGAIVDGCSNRDMAQKFALSEQTIKHHLTSIFAKVGVSNRLELALFAMRHRVNP
jgi:two-component system nitrate/nitrite response regulator NarL